MTLIQWKNKKTFKGFICVHLWLQTGLFSQPNGYGMVEVWEQTASLLTHGPQRVGQQHPPGLGDVLQQQTGDAAMGHGVPVDTVVGAVLQGEAEVEVEVQNVPLVGVGQSPAVEVCLDHIVTELWGFVLNLNKNTT